MTRDDIKIDDIVRLTSPVLNNTRSHKNTIIGKVIAVFDALTPDGQEGNLEIDIQYDFNKWIRYKPLIDGGFIEVLERKI